MTTEDVAEPNRTVDGPNRTVDGLNRTVDGLNRTTVRVPLRWRDLDALGHVYHGTYLTILDEARSLWLSRGLGLADPSPHVIVRFEIDYDSELTLGVENGGEPHVSVDFALEKIGTTSIRTVETMRGPDGGVVSRSHAVLVFWDGDARVPRAPSPEDRSRLEEALLK